ncbi:MAG: tyrosine--tRNA ligase [bacterium]|nr:tyrosine--tRNA ligase [bacterium]
MDRIEEILTRGVANIIPNQSELEKVLKSEKKLNVYLGIDPTAVKIHLGHTVPLRILQKLAELGHNVTFLIGDFTALIGDTSDKDSERPVLTSGEIEKNFQTYKKQAEKILDFSKVKVRYNSEWLKKLEFEDIVKLAQHFSAGDFAGRELIKKRLNDGTHVGLHEFLYPVMQGYDSYFLDTDIQVGGTDQTFNMQAGRTLQKDLRNKNSFIIAVEFLMGTDGRKMSKTWGNAIWLEDEPSDMYRKVMAINDDLIVEYFALATNIPIEEVKNIEKRLEEGKSQMEIKKELAFEIVRELHSKEAAEKAQENFKKTVQEKEIPSDIKEYSTSDKERGIVDLLMEINLASSKSEAKRLVDQGGVEVDGGVIKSANESVKLKNEMIIKVGKKNFVKIKLH